MSFSQSLIEGSADASVSADGTLPRALITRPEDLSDACSCSLMDESIPFSFPVFIRANSTFKENGHTVLQLFAEAADSVIISWWESAVP
ncbi:hypothetical protein ACFXPQ_25740 [Streptomyces lydicus]|uniref:hypothetical protein n=1 Tax=Streptomyces lydicus TaxID=47763 RepID=UPI0036C26283